MKVKVYEHINVRNEALKVLKKEWQAADPSAHICRFPQPSDEVVTDKIKDLGLVTPVFKYSARLLQFGSVSDCDGAWPVAILVKEDGFLAEEPVENIKVTKDAEV